MLGDVVRVRSTPRVTAIALYVTLFTAVGASVPYLPVYYQSLGLPFGAIGLLAAVAALCGLVAAPAWGAAADQLVGPRTALGAAAVASAACALGLALAAAPAIAILLAVLYALAFAGIAPVLDAHALEQVADDRHRYARLRVWGSVSFVFATVVVGALIESTDLRAMFAVLIVALAATVVLSLSLPRRTGTVPRHHRSGLRVVLRHRPMMAFVAALLVAWSASTAINGFLSIYLISLDAPAILVGGAWAVGAIIEIPVMVAFPALAARLGVSWLLVIGAVMLVLRGTLFTLTTDPLVITLGMLLHGVGFALLLVGGVTYVARLAPAGSAATAQGVLSGVVFGLAQALGPGLAGIVAGSVGIRSMFVVATGASVLGVFAVFAAVRSSLRERT